MQTSSINQPSTTSTATPLCSTDDLMSRLQDAFAAHQEAGRQNAKGVTLSTPDMKALRKLATMGSRESKGALVPMLLGLELRENRILPEGLAVLELSYGGIRVLDLRGKEPEDEG